MTYGHYGKAGRLLSAFLTCVLIAVAALPYAEAHSGVSLSGYGTATIDGIIGAGEWAAAGTKTFGPFGPTGTEFSGTLYMMNDGTDLYMAVSISGDPDYGAPADFDSFVSLFDNDHDGVQEPGDDMLGAGNLLAGPFADWYYLMPTWADDLPAGTPDGQGAGSQFAPNLNHFELSHPLDSADDAHDFSLSVGQTVGFALEVMVDGGSYPGLGEEGYPSTYADYVVASPPPTPTPTPRPVGGVLISVNKLDLLAPYLALLGLVGAVTAAVAAKRRKAQQP